MRVLPCIYASDVVIVAVKILQFGVASEIYFRNIIVIDIELNQFRIPADIQALQPVHSRINPLTGGQIADIQGPDLIILKP